MKGITKLPTIIQKNIKLVFRSYSSLLLLVLGPLLLILLVGFAFGGSALHDINIGIIKYEYTDGEMLFDYTRKPKRNQELNSFQQLNG